LRVRKIGATVKAHEIPQRSPQMTNPKRFSGWHDAERRAAVEIRDRLFRVGTLAAFVFVALALVAARRYWGG
jgi:hypothetical protein